MTHPLPTSEDLAWQASRYCLAEMSAEEQAAFELLLVEYQEAREAVAEAMLLLSAVHSAERQSSAPAEVCLPAKGTSQESRGFHWATFGMVAASLLLLVSASAWLGLNRFSQQVAQDNAAVTAQWLASSEQAEATWNGDSDELAASDEAGDAAVDSVEGNLPPDWMLVAVSQEHMPLFENGSSGDGDALPDGTAVDRFPVEN